ncbi:hypothetical protein GGX14DRAFT_430211 [Mycena pura]|uniref:Uncharacterized protein n=1 Tax=Mycena pura TaxID=153505 RepID=A0AAD6VSP3_9AGAR|nr:hypothetical protein GGX14DRAFT_430211 [Mycena pura]
MSSESSSASSASSSKSASPEPEVPFAKANKSKAAQKAKRDAPAEKGRNDGTDPHWAYQPPHNAVRLEESADVGEFDWDALNGNDADLELWLIRIPDGVKPKYLEAAQLEIPADRKKTAKMGVLQRKHVAYDVWAVGDDTPEALPIGGEEIKGLSCLLPRKSKKGRLYQAPIPVTRTIVVAAQEARPIPESSSPISPDVYKNPPREMHTKELLKHTFRPYGAGLGKVGARPGHAKIPMDIEVDHEELVPEPVETVLTVKGESKQAKGKKRKGEEGRESPKKPKKVKTAS